MKTFQRGSVTVSGDVTVSADEFWKLLRDWPAAMKWIPRDSASPPIDVTLKPGDDVNRLPCSRVMHFDVSSGFPASWEETLLFADPQARRIYYTFSGIPDGMRNYIATTIVDDTGRGTAHITCSSSFDLPNTGASMEETNKFLRDVYEHVIIRGIEAAIKREKSSV